MSIVPQIVRPVWADPQFVCSQNDYRVTTVTVSSGSPTLLLKNDPSRWAFGVYVAGAIATGENPCLSPDPDPSVSGPVFSAAGQWFTLLEFGPLVCTEWYVKNVTSATLTIIELVNS